MSAGSSRVGWGIDAHRLDGNPPLLLGGVEVSSSRGVSATSDGDVVAHAVSDALLGAAVLGDLGQHFPSSDPAWEGADSMEMLRQVAGMAIEAGWQPSHVDVTVIGESIRVSPHRDAIRSSIGGALSLNEESVSVKATTTDGMGFIGRGDGIAAIAAVTVEPLP